MQKSRYTDEQIAFALRQAETGTPVRGANFFNRQNPHCLTDGPATTYYYS